jgi:TadE-like protein
MKRTTDVLRHAVRRRVDAARGDSGVGSRAGRATATAPDAAGRRAYGDRGMSAIEFVFLTPVLFFMIFATVQFGLYFFADHVAQAAAQAGARKARAEADGNPGGWQGKAKSTAQTYIDQLGPNLLDGQAIVPFQPDPATVGVRVTATVPTIFPGLHFHVHEESQGPVERFVEDNGG